MSKSASPWRVMPPSHPQIALDQRKRYAGPRQLDDAESRSASFACLAPGSWRKHTAELNHENLRRNGLSRRNVIQEAIAITAVASLQGAAPVGAQPAAATRRDIVSFAQKKSRLAT